MFHKITNDNGKTLAIQKAPLHSAKGLEARINKNALLQNMPL